MIEVIVGLALLLNAQGQPVEAPAVVSFSSMEECRRTQADLDAHFKQNFPELSFSMACLEPEDFVAPEETV